MKNKNEYGGQTSKRMSVRPLQKQSTATAARAKTAPVRMATAVTGEEKISGTTKGGPADQSVKGGSTHGPQDEPRRFKVRRYRPAQLPDKKTQIGMQADRESKGGGLKGHDETPGFRKKQGIMPSRGGRT